MSLRAFEDLKEEGVSVVAGLSWADELRRVSLAVSQGGGRPAPGRHQLFYLLHWTSDASRFGITVHRGRDLEESEAWWDLERALAKPPPFVTEQDADILGRLREAGMDEEGGLQAFALQGTQAGDLLRRVLQTGRLALSSDLSPLLSGESRPGVLAWRIDATGYQRPCFRALDESSLTIPLLPPWYVDLDRALLGSLEVPGDPDVIARLFAMPPLPDQRAALVAEVLAELAPDLPPPDAYAQASLRGIVAEPRPVLRVKTLEVRTRLAWRDYPVAQESSRFDVALPSFRYGEAEVGIVPEQIFVTLDDGETVRVHRRLEAEGACLQNLADVGLQPLPVDTLGMVGCTPEAMYALAAETDWPNFMQDGCQRLRQAGWEIEFDSEFRHHALQVDAWEAELVSAGQGWFSLDMGVVVDGERVPLAPLLASLFQRDTRWLETAELLGIPDDELIELRTPDNKRLRVPAARLKPIAATLVDLFDGFDGGQRLRISRFDAQRLKALHDTSRWQFRGQ